MNKNEKADIHSGIAWAITFALAAIIMSIIAIATRYPRTDLSMDYMGVIVGILSLLVTVLLGWQIFQVIDLRKTKEEIDKRIDVKFEDFNSYVDATSFFNLCKMYHQTFNLLNQISLKTETKRPTTDLLEGCFSHIGNAFEQCNASPIKNLLPDLYSELKSLIGYVEDFNKELKNVKLDTIRKVINGVMEDSNTPNDIDKHSIIKRLLNIQSIIENSK